MPLPILGAINMIFAPAKIISGAKSSIAFVVKYWKQLLIGALVFLVFHQNFMQFEFLKIVGVRTIPGIEQQYKDDIDRLKIDLSDCRQSNERLKGAIESVNTQVDKWANVSSQLQKQHDELVEEITKMRKDTEQTVQNIFDEPTPETCEAAFDYLKDAAKSEELRW